MDASPIKLNVRGLQYEVVLHGSRRNWRSARTVVWPEGTTQQVTERGALLKEVEGRYPIPFSSLCLRFTSSGAWYSVPPNAFNGTYLTSGNELFASALARWSPTAYASLRGSVNAKQGSGDYIITQPNGDIYSGGTFTTAREGKSHCS